MSELTQLKFSDIQYSSTATYENDEGEGFLVQISGINKLEVEEQINNLRVSLETENNSNNADSDLKILADFADINKSEFKLSFGNDEFMERSKPEPGTIIITRQPGQLLEVKNAYIVGPYKKVEARLSASGGTAYFSLYEAPGRNGPWTEVRGKQNIEVLSGKSKPLNYETNSPKYFYLKLRGQSGIRYKVSGTWTIR
ncbi:hypothetical protein BJP36_26545 [Moorena producens JHB]|uniref:Uncharacterized protein n=1 Tax=Moorena producens (strain JHB) TaxID=1454205 RepID=A0A1D9G5T2_MOOP1|nr:hypothetical protein [Moorena producens]AOY82943.1 hypothetical protein BJP36_26545 [Moorena producens JHB]